MTPEQIRERMGQIAAQLGQFSNRADFTAEETTEIDAMNEEFATLSKQLEASDKVAAMAAMAAKSTRQTAPAPTSANMKVEVQASHKERNGGFNNTGEFLKAVKAQATGNIDPKIKNVLMERSGEDGGFMVPEEMSNTILSTLQTEESLFAKTTQILVTGNSLSIPVDETQPWAGGVQALWTQEAGLIKESSFNFRTAHMRLHKLATIVKATEELLEDAVAMESYIKAKAPAAIMHKLNEAILTGDGVGKPKGLLNSGAKIVIPKEVGQDPDSVVAENIIKMYAAMLPSSRAKAAWFINPQAEAALMLMKNANGDFLYLQPGSPMNQAPFGMLFGRPVIPLMSSMKQLGDEGDIVFADLSQYYTIIKAGGVKNAVSTHLHFDREIVAYRFTLRVDGASLIANPVTTEFGGHKMSSVVTLADR